MRIDPGRSRSAGGDGHLRAYAETLFMVGSVTAVGLAGASVIPETVTDLLYLLPVLAAASLHGLRGGLLAAVASAAAYDFFFTAPVHRLWVTDPVDLVTVAVLLGVALFTGRLTARLRAQTQAAAAQAAQDAALAGFARALVGVSDVTELGRAICTEIGRLLGSNAVLVLSDDGPDDGGTLVRSGDDPDRPTPRLVASAPPLDELETLDRAAARQAIAAGLPAGRGTSAVPGADWTFYPLTTAQGTVAAIGLARDDGLTPVPAGRRVLLDTVLDQAALAIERQRLATEVQEVARLRERDRLRSALLSSVGHDLRTPLTAVLAAAAALRQDSNADAGIVATLESEARRLDRYIANLLDMARIEAGSIRLRIEPVDLTDAVAAALRDVGRSLQGRMPHVAVPADLPLVRLDPQLFHHCLINLLDNAARHGAGTPVSIVGERTSGGVSLVVLDEGPGLPPGGDVFGRFIGSDRTGGAGLGLAIVKGFAEAMGFGIEAGNRGRTGGAAFRLHFPETLLVTAMAAEAAE